MAFASKAALAFSARFVEDASGVRIVFEWSERVMVYLLMKGQETNSW